MNTRPIAALVAAARVQSICSISAAVAAVIASSGFAADFPQPTNSEKDMSTVAMPAENAAAALQLPAGFRTTVFASEPDVQNPIAMAWDSKGRLWIAENYTYAERTQQFDWNLRDRVLIFDDKDGDGRFDERKVFTDDAQVLTSVEVGHGGTWLMCPPRLLFVPDQNGDDVPDGPAEVVLDGFKVARENYHNFANGLRWGPDGWLYGRTGHSCPGKIGVPGTPEEQRKTLAGGLWRYHPTRKTVEVLTSGTTNPWGHDWNEHGEAFFVNTVNGHLWHLIPGAKFVRGTSRDPSRRTYELIDHHADHWHFDTGRSWMDSRNGAANELGGGHAHSGAMIYLGDNWPTEYRGRLFTLNFHGRRANQERLERSGSGYVGRHAEDIAINPDPWFRGVDLSYGPDGGVFVLDWSDTGECHENTGVHRTSGRIYKITHGQPKRPEIQDIRKLPVQELIALHSHANEWFVRQARLALAERANAGEPMQEVHAGLRELFEKAPDAATKLRAVFSLHVTGGASREFLRAQLRHADENVRTCAVRLLTDAWQIDDVMSVPAAGAGDKVHAEAAELREELVKLAREDSSGLVRLALASTLQRLPVSERVHLAAALVSRKEDAGDHNLPLLLWYGLIPVADSDPGALVKVAEKCEWPTTRTFIARALAEDLETAPASLNELLTHAAGGASAEWRRDILQGVSDALSGWRKATKPGVWDALQEALANSTDSVLSSRVRELSAVFGDGRALDEIQKIALDSKAASDVRESALRTLIDSRPPNLREICEELLSESHINVTAARGLSLFDDPEIGVALVKSYRRFREPQRPQILSTLVSRKQFAHSLLTAVAEGKIPRGDLSAFHVRQIRSFDDPSLNALATQVWGELRETPEVKLQTIARLKERMTPAVLSTADKGKGRVAFATLCSACHKLYGEGGTIGPDLTGSGRDNLDYLLENIVDPSAVVNADFRMTVVKLKDGRLLNGVITARTDRTLTLRSLTETTVLELGDIETSETSALSQMPEGLIETLSEEQSRDLLAYLLHPSQVPLSQSGTAAAQ